MTISGVSGRTSYIGSGILDLRSQLDTLTQQLASGKISNTYAGQGSGRSLAIGLRSQLSGLAGYADTAVNLNTRINVANLSLQRLVDVGSSVKGAAVSAVSAIDNNGQTAGQKTASLGFFDSVDMLNARSGDRYLFSGRATDTPPVTAADVIMNGNGAQAGLKQLILERKQADVGTSGLGRVVLTAPSATSVQIAEDASPSEFGLKLNAITSTLTGATITQPTGTPAAMSVDLGATNPAEGESGQVHLQSAGRHHRGHHADGLDGDAAAGQQLRHRRQPDRDGGQSQRRAQYLDRSAGQWAAGRGIGGDGRRQFLRPTADARRHHTARRGDHTGGGHAGEHRQLVPGRNRHGFRARYRRRADRSIDHGAIWRPRQRTGAALATADRRGICRGDRRR